jgi:CRISPR/Cas system-associated exonuclease Cas4 (RecB family)
VKLQEILDLDTIFNDYDQNLNNDSDRIPDGKFHPSSFGGCSRKLYYAYHRTAPQNNISPGLRRTFNHGTVVHDWIQEKLIKAIGVSPINNPNVCISVHNEVKINDYQWSIDHNVSGSIDAVFTFEQPIGDFQAGDKVVYELKTSASKTWDSLKSPIHKHILQANAYAAAIGAKWIIYDYYNKDKDVHKRFYLPADEQVQQQISNELYNIMLACTSGQEVARQPSTWECSSCPYAYVCKPEDE